jgi:inosose dehydratase
MKEQRAMSDFLSRIGGAPISWGVCEAPGWGLMLPYDRVLAEARSLGISAFEQGALGWLPTEPARQREIMQRYGMQLLGGFVPLVLHEPARRDEMLARADAIAADMAACGGTFFITAVVASLDAWYRPELDDAAWVEMLANLERVDTITYAHGLVQAVHPHVDTLIETADEFHRFLNECDVRCCFDTGHLTVGGADVVAIAGEHLDRIAVVHLKDVDPGAAARQRSGELTLMGATKAGMFPSLGDGYVRIAEVVQTLESQGYGGWYVMETDVAIDAEPAEGEGPIRGVARSLAYLRSLDVAAPAAR